MTDPLLGIVVPLVCRDCGLTWFDGRTSCDHKVYESEAGLYEIALRPFDPTEFPPMVEVVPEPEAGYVPSLTDFEDMARMMDSHRPVTAVVAGEIMTGRRVGRHFRPTDADGLRDALENTSDAMDELKGRD